MFFPLISKSFQPSPVEAAGNSFCCAGILNLNQWRSNSRNKELDLDSCSGHTIVGEVSAGNGEVVQGADVPGGCGRVIQIPILWAGDLVLFASSLFCFRNVWVQKLEIGCDILISVSLHVWMSGTHYTWPPGWGGLFWAQTPLCWAELCVWELDLCPSCKTPQCESGQGMALPQSCSMTIVQGV